MNRLSILTDSSVKSEDIRQPLAGMFEIQFIGFDDIQDAAPDQYTIVDVNQNDAARLLELKDWLKRKPKNGTTIFVVGTNARIESVRANAVGATDIIHRPINGKTLVTKLLGDFSSLADEPPEFANEKSEGIASAYEALQDIFSSACLGGSLNSTMINAASEPIIHHIETEGLASWIDTVRKHHSQTYQHSLLVTGTAVGFARQLGLSHADREQLSFAGMLHDIGKARIPVAILEKPGPLDKDELALMRQHPQFGLEALESVPEIQKEMIDMVVHHHECLDGSGYPHGLMAEKISDLVRIVTISDIFAALIERRSYKPPLSAEAAYQIMLNMGPKLDKDLLREFRFVSQLHLDA
jgi:putative nucleotidyltransferase with HDIG domain